MELDCESYSLDYESAKAFYESLGNVSVSRESADSKESASRRATRTAAGSSGAAVSISGSRILENQDATEGATAGGIAERTTTWIERPTPTGQAESNNGVQHIRPTKGNLLVSSMIIVLLLFSVLDAV